MEFSNPFINMGHFLWIILKCMILFFSSFPTFFCVLTKKLLPRDVKQELPKIELRSINKTAINYLTQ